MHRDRVYYCTRVVLPPLQYVGTVCVSWVRHVRPAPAPQQRTAQEIVPCRQGAALELDHWYGDNPSQSAILFVTAGPVTVDSHPQPVYRECSAHVQCARMAPN